MKIKLLRHLFFSLLLISSNVSTLAVNGDCKITFVSDILMAQFKCQTSFRVHKQQQNLPCSRISSRYNYELARKQNYFTDVSTQQLLKTLRLPKDKDAESTISSCHNFSFKMQNSKGNQTGLFIINKKLSTDSHQRRILQTG